MRPGISFTVQMDQGAINRLSDTEGSAVVKDLFRRGKRVEAQAKRDCPVDTGRLRASITTEVFATGTDLGVRVGSNVNYASYVHDGTRYMRGRPFLLRALDAAR